MGNTKGRKLRLLGLNRRIRFGLLGDHSLLDTLLHYIGLYFGIHGGDQCQLQFKPSQLELVEPAKVSPYLNLCLKQIRFVTS